MSVQVDVGYVVTASIRVHCTLTLFGEDLVNLDSTGVTLAGCGPTPAGDCVGSRPRKPRIDSEWALGSPCN